MIVRIDEFLDKSSADTPYTWMGACLQTDLSLYSVLMVKQDPQLVLTATAQKQ